MLNIRRYLIYGATGHQRWTSGHSEAVRRALIEYWVNQGFLDPVTLTATEKVPIAGALDPDIVAAVSRMSLTL